MVCEFLHVASTFNIVHGPRLYIMTPMAALSDLAFLLTCSEVFGGFWVPLIATGFSLISAGGRQMLNRTLTNSIEAIMLQLMLYCLVRKQQSKERYWRWDLLMRVPLTLGCIVRNTMMVQCAPILALSYFEDICRRRGIIRTTLTNLIWLAGFLGMITLIDTRYYE
jgi:hypothetical protein